MRIPVFWVSYQVRPSTSLLSYMDWLENINFDCSMFRYDTFQLVNNKGAEQFAWMCRLVCAFVARKPCGQVFSRQGTCDFQQCGILTSVDSGEPVQPLFKLRD